MSQSFHIAKLQNAAIVMARVAKYVLTLSPAKAWKIEITEARSERSIQQCRYLNGVAYKLICEKTGYERDDVSEYLCGTYWGWHDKRVPKTPRNPEGVESVPLRTTTTDEHGARAVLGKIEFAEYVAFVQRFAARKLNLYIPDPDPDYAEKQEAA